MATLRELVVSLGIDVDSKSFKEAEVAIADVKAGLFAIGAAAVGAAGSMFGLAKETANYSDFVKDTSIAVGISQEALQKFGFAAQLSGSSAAEFGNSMRFLSRAIADTNNPSSEASKTFQKLGVNVRDANGNLRPTEDVFLSLADSFKRLPADANKTNLALELFGRAGAGMIQTLDNGSEGIQKLAGELESLGGVFSEAQIQAGTDFNDALDKLKATFLGITRTIGFALIPVVKDIVDGIQDFIKENRELIATGIQNFFKEVTSTISAFYKIAKTVVIVLVDLTKGFNALLSPLGGIIGALKLAAIGFGLYTTGRLVQGVMAAVAAFRTFGNVALVAQLKALAIPLAIGAAVAAVLLIVEDLYAFFQGRPSVLGFLLKNKDQILQSVLNFFKVMGEGIWNLAKQIGGWIFDIVRGWIGTILNFIKSIPSLLNSGIKSLTGIDIGARVTGLLDKTAAINPFSNFAPAGPMLPSSTNTNTSNISRTQINAPITVTAPAGSNPEDVGIAVQKAAQEVFDKQLRETFRSANTVVER